MNVYIIASEGGMCKIGKAADPASRMSQFTTAHPYKLSVAHVFPCASDSEAFTLEGAAHRALAVHRMQGEWFKVTPEQAKEAIDGLTAPKKRRMEDWLAREVCRVIARLSDVQKTLAQTVYGDADLMPELLAGELRALADSVENVEDDI